MSESRRLRKPLLVLAMAAACAGGVWAAEVGEEAPKFANPDLQGNYVRHGSVVGKKWVVVNFFATWCVPCKEELPELEALQQEAGEDRLQIIVFATDKEKNDVKAFFEERPTNVTILLDPYQVAYQRYNKAEDGIPTIFLIDAEGKIVMRHVGYDAEFIAAMSQMILGGSE